MRSEERLQEMIDIIPVLAWSARNDGTVEFLNRPWLDYTGLTLEEASGWGWAQALHPDDLNAVVNYWKSLVQSGEAGEVEARIRRRDGVFRWFLFRASPLCDQSGRIVLWCGTNTDIEDRRIAEELLRNREGEFRLVLDNMPGLVCTLTAKGEVEFANRRALEYFGETLDQLSEWARSDLHQPEDRPKEMDVGSSPVIGTPFEAELPMRAANGAPRWFHLRRVPVCDAHGAVIRWYVLLTDVHDRRLAEIALRDSEARLRLLVNSLAGQIAEMSPSGELQFVNQQTIEYFGKTLEELKSWGQGGEVHPDDLPGVITAWQRSVESGETYSIDHRLRRADGVYRWFHAQGHPVRESTGRIASWYVLLTDIEDRKQMEEKLRQSEADLLTAQRLSLTGSFKLDIASGKVSVSPEILRAYAVSPTCNVEDPDFWFERIHPEDRQKTRELFENSVAQRCNYEADYRIVLPDGAIRFQHAVGHPVSGPSGELIQFIGTATDVTERNQLERAVEHERDRLRLILDLNNRVASQLELSELFRAISSELRRVFLCDYVGLVCPDESGKYFRQVMVDYPGSKGVFQVGGSYPIDASCSGVAYRTRKPFMIRDLSEGRQFWSRDKDFNKAVSTEPFKSGCFLPMMSRGEALGVLQVTSLKEHAFTPEDLTFLEQVATQFAITLKNALEYEKANEVKEQLQDENLVLREQIDQTLMFEEIVGSSQTLQSVLSKLVKVAPTDSTVLITGETGTGKELVARAIHKRPRRADRAFVSVNCASIPSSLIGSELFGHEKGAFTGALQQRLGRFELARGGTIFLDEVGELPSETQIALLRVLQERQFERVGGNRIIPADVRVIAATNRDLSAAIAAGNFRADLFYRLNVFPIDMPPLRHRREDIPLLIEYFVKRLSSSMGKRIHRIDKRTFDLCLRYSWPGNIRELQNIVERSVILCEGDTLSLDESWLSIVKSGTGPPEPSGPLRETLLEREIKIIEDALAACKGKIAGPSGAAARLGIPPSTLDSKIKQFKIKRRQFISRD
jgi:formate hydrogenlyase transcriptional activator